MAVDVERGHGGAGREGAVAKALEERDITAGTRVGHDVGMTVAVEIAGGHGIRIVAHVGNQRVAREGSVAEAFVITQIP